MYPFSNILSVGVNATIEIGDKATTYQRIQRFAVGINDKVQRVILGWVQRISLGCGVSYKLRILSIATLQLASKITKKRISGLDRRINGITEKLWRGTIVKMDGIKYTLLDYESFRIVAARRDRLSQDTNAEVYAENFMQAWLEPREGGVFVDIGAHIGKYTLTVAKAVGNKGLVVAIEPHSSNYQTLVRNVMLNQLENVVALNLAAWNKDCQLKLFIGNVAGHHSPKINSGLGWVKVKARVMDHVFKDLGIGQIDWIKIDVEGAEYEVLLGLKETIKTHRPRIIIEVFNENIERVKRFMEEYGYNLIRISPIFEEDTYFFCESTSS